MSYERQLLFGEVKSSLGAYPGLSKTSYLCSSFFVDITNTTNADSGAVQVRGPVRGENEVRTRSDSCP